MSSPITAATPIDFAATFQALTGNAPFPWQRALYQKFVEGEIPKSCNLPTGLGKTSVVTVWLIALANHPDTTPRRLVYVVNRRTVVDQTTTEVEGWREKLATGGLHDALTSLCSLPLKEKESPLALSTLAASTPTIACGRPTRPGRQ